MRDIMIKIFLEDGRGARKKERKKERERKRECVRRIKLKSKQQNDRTIV